MFCVIAKVIIKGRSFQKLNTFAAMNFLSIAVLVVVGIENVVSQLQFIDPDSQVEYLQANGGWGDNDPLYPQGNQFIGTPQTSYYGQDQFIGQQNPYYGHDQYMGMGDPYQQMSDPYNPYMGQANQYIGQRNPYGGDALFYGQTDPYMGHDSQLMGLGEL